MTAQIIDAAEFAAKRAENWRLLWESIGRDTDAQLAACAERMRLERERPCDDE